MRRGALRHQPTCAGCNGRDTSSLGSLEPIARSDKARGARSGESPGHPKASPTTANRRWPEPLLQAGCGACRDHRCARAIELQSAEPIPTTAEPCADCPDAAVRLVWAQSGRSDGRCGVAAHKKAPPAGEQEALRAKGSRPERSALNAVFEHLAGGEGGNLFGGDGDLFAGLGV